MTSFLSPSRPRLANGAPCYAHHGVTSALPQINITPEENGFQLSLLLPIASRSYSWHSKYCTTAEEVGAICAAYAVDPEKTMKEVFLWEESKKLPEDLDIDLGI